MAIDIPTPIKIEDTLFKAEVIDLDEYVSPEVAVARFHKKVCNKLKTFYVDEHEKNLLTLMKWYIETLNEDNFELEASQSFVKNMCTHIHFFHMNFLELNWPSPNEYLDNMEDIMALYLDFQCEFFAKNLKRNQNIVKHLTQVLGNYLLYQEDRVFNVLLKIKLNGTSEREKQFMDNIFRIMLSPVPKDITDIAFCRAYILHQRWKKVQNAEMYKTIDNLLYKNYGQTPNAVNTNPVLKEVLHPQNDSLLDILAHLMDSDKILCESYFKYIESLKSQEGIIRDVKNIELDGQTSPPLDSDEENEEIFNSSPTVTSTNCANEDVIKMENSDEDDCIVVGEGTVDCDPEETEIVHEILDDDDDIESIIYFAAKQPVQGKPSPTKKIRQQPEISFLNSIPELPIQEINSNKENSNSKIRLQTTSISPLSPKAHNLHNDSVKSREILSRKFTRKKNENVIADIVIDDTDDILCTGLDADASDWDKTKSNNNESEEPSHIFVGLVTPPTSHDDQHGYERDFNSEHLENDCYEQKMNIKEMENSCLMPHSTNSSNSDFCTGSNVPEKITNESYVSPTSPDISSTCEPNDLIVEYDQETISQLHEETVETTNEALDNSINEKLVVDKTPSKTLNSRQENSPFSNIQIEKTYSVSHLSNESIDISSKDGTNDCSEENRSMNDSMEEAYLLPDLEHDNLNVREDEIIFSRNSPSSATTLQDKDPENQYIINQLDKYIQENTTNESVVHENVISDGSASKDIGSHLPEKNVLDNQMQKEIINDNYLKEISIAGDTSNVIINANNCNREKTVAMEGFTKEVCRKNGEKSDPNTDEEICKNALTKQLKVSVPRLEIKSPEKKMDVIFSSKRKIRKFDAEVHLRYNELKGEHGLDDCLNGVPEKINYHPDFDTDFDLFEDSISIGEQEIPLLNNSTSTTSPSSIVSPEFDGIDDFKNYLANYQEENSITSSKISPLSHLSDRALKPSSLESKRQRLKSDNNKNLLVPQIKRKRIAFAEEEVIHTKSTHEPIINPTNQIQGILKKTTMHAPVMIIPKEQMNLESLNYFSVKLNDYYLQSNPCVVIERLSELEIKEWERVSEKARRKRLLKQRISQPFSPLATSMTMFRVDYDKQTPLVSPNLTVHYRSPPDQNWRSNSLDVKINPQDEGRVESDVEDCEYFYIPTMCKNKCCSHLPKQFSKLKLSNDSNLTISKVRSNPFCIKMIGGNLNATEKSKSTTKSFIDLKLVNKIVENFDKCDESINSFDFINQPAAIPEVEEFEKTLKMEEVTKVSTIPSDLDNLNLRKFSPSPIMTYFSPQSPVYAYFSDSNLNDAPNSFRINEDIDDEQEINVEELEESSNDRRIEIQMGKEELNHDNSASKRKVDTFQDAKTVRIKSDLIAKETKEAPQTRLPLKKRKHSLANAPEADSDEETIGPEVIEEIIKRARAEENESDISYPATPAISIAEVQERLETQPRTFKTPAEKKEMPPPSIPDYLSVPKIITEQYNTHTYNNPTINYHMNNVPYPFFPCTYFSPILCTPAFDVNVVNAHQPASATQIPHQPENETKIKKEKRSRRKRRD